MLTTFKGKGLFADDHPLGCGVLGRGGTPVVSWFMNESDLRVVLGASFSNHTGITPGKPIIQVDFDPLVPGKFHAVECPVRVEIGVTVARRGIRVTKREELERAMQAVLAHKGPVLLEVMTDVALL